MFANQSLSPCLYYRIRDDLIANFPAAVQAINDAAANLRKVPIPPTTFAHHAAFRFVEKPLYSWMNAAIGGLGDRYSYMWRSGRFFPSHTVMSGPSWDIDLTYILKPDKNGFERKTAVYMPKGKDVVAFRKNAGVPMPMPSYPHMKRPQVALKRLYLMRQIAINLPHALSAIEDAKDNFARSEVANEFLVHSLPIKRALDIGLTTVFHATTDMGYDSIKPDMHAARFLGYFGQLEDQFGEVTPTIVSQQGFIDPLSYLSRSDWNKCLVVSKGVRLARSLDKSQLLPVFGGNACREVDIVLMQASLHNVILKYGVQLHPINASKVDPSVKTAFTGI